MAGGSDFCQAGGEITERLWVPLGTKDFGSIIAALPEDRVMTVGERVDLRFDPARAHLFPHEEIVRSAH